MLSFNTLLKNVFYKLGFQVGTHPKTCLIVPIMVSILFSTAFLQFKFNGDFVHLFSSQGEPIIKEETLLKTYFKQNQFGEFDPSRKTGVGNLVR